MIDVSVVILQDDVNFTSAEIDAGTEEYVASTCPENELFDGEDSLLLTRPVSKAENRVSYLCLKVGGKVSCILILGTGWR
jgi:hypothetical protein